MPLLAAAVCPHPPMIVPAVATGAASELDGLRTACDEAVARLLAASPDTVCVVGAAANRVPQLVQNRFAGPFAAPQFGQTFDADKRLPTGNRDGG